MHRTNTLAATARTLAAATLALAVLPLWGCLSQQAADPDRDRSWDDAAVKIHWPARNTEILDEVIKNTPRRITRLVVDGTLPVSEIDRRWLDAARRPEGRIYYHRKYGQGVIRIVRYAGRSYRRFVSYSPLADRPIDTKVPESLEALRDWLAAYVKESVPGLKPVDEKHIASLYEGTSIDIRTPEGRKPIGLVIHMAGLGSMEYEQPLLDELQSRGWAILRIATPPVWWYEGKPYLITSRAEIEPTGRRIAEVVDDLVAEPAYAAEAALEFMAEERPEIPQSPLVMVGCSAGALAAPAVVARLGERVDAAVLVGGGANLLKLSQTSDLTDGGIRVQWSDQIGNVSDRQRLYDAYIQASQLDPVRTAASMRHMPVLLVHASLDSTVPASGGELLWETLGRPERWNYFGGHRMLFWRLEDHAAAISQWIDQRAPEARRLAEARARALRGSLDAAPPEHH